MRMGSDKVDLAVQQKNDGKKPSVQTVFSCTHFAMPYYTGSRSVMRNVLPWASNWSCCVLHGTGTFAGQPAADVPAGLAAVTGADRGRDCTFSKRIGGILL